MEALIVLLAFLAWNALGFYGGVIMVTKGEGRDFKPDDITLGLWMGLGGPIILAIAMLCMLMDKHSDKVLFRGRGK